MSESSEPIVICCPKHDVKAEIHKEEDLTAFIDTHRRCGVLETYEGEMLTGRYDPPENWMN